MANGSAMDSMMKWVDQRLPVFTFMNHELRGL